MDAKSPKGAGLIAASYSFRHGHRRGKDIADHEAFDRARWDGYQEETGRR
jgi:hypothetical protein